MRKEARMGRCTEIYSPFPHSPATEQFSSLHFFEKTPTPMDSGLEARYSFTPDRDSIRFIHRAMVFWVEIQSCCES